MLNGAVMYSRSIEVGVPPSVVMTRPSKVAGPEVSEIPCIAILTAWPLTKLPSAVVCDVWFRLALSLAISMLCQQTKLVLVEVGV